MSAPASAPAHIRVTVDEHDAPARTGLGQYAPIEIGVDEHGERVAWSPAARAHALISGPTGFGSNVLTVHLISTLRNRGGRTLLIDPKGLNHGPNVEQAAYHPDDQADLLRSVHELLEHRSEAMRSDQTPPEGFTPVLLAIEHFEAFRDAAGTTANLAELDDLLQLGRTVGIHVLTTLESDTDSYFIGPRSPSFNIRLSSPGAHQTTSPASSSTTSATPKGN